MTEIAAHRPRMTPLADMKPHPRNYRSHPPEQLQELVESIRRHGVYRNVVTANDLTLLAGHGIAEAARLADITEIPAVVLEIDPDSPAALKLVVADNELAWFAVTDDRLLTELLNDMPSLDATGFDRESLMELIYVTRHEGEVDSLQAAAELAGLAEPPPERPWQLCINFEDVQTRDSFVARYEIPDMGRDRRVWTIEV